MKISNKEKKIEDVYVIPKNEPLYSRPVIISSEFVENSIFPFLDKNQYALFIYSLSVIKENSTKLDDCKFTWRYFVERSLKHIPKYKDFLKSMNDLGEKIFMLKKPEGGYRQINWFEYIDFPEEEEFNIDSEITFKIQPNLTPYLLELQNTPYVKSLYKIANKLGNTRNFHLYYILKHSIDFVSNHRNVIDKELTLKELNTIFSTKYRYAHLNDKILKSALKIINSDTEINIKYKPLKKGRKVTSVKFTVKYNKLKAPKLPKLEEPQSKVLDTEIEQICNQIEQLQIVKAKGETLNKSTIYQLITNFPLLVVQSEIKEAIRKINTGEAIIGKGTIIGWLINQVKNQTYTTNQQSQIEKAQQQQQQLNFLQRSTNDKNDIEKPAYLNKAENLKKFQSLNLSEQDIYNLLSNVFYTKKEPLFERELADTINFIKNYRKNFEPEKNEILVEIILRYYRN